MDLKSSFSLQMIISDNFSDYSDFNFKIHFRKMNLPQKKFSLSLEHFFLTVGQNNFGNKIPFLYKLKKKFKRKNESGNTLLTRSYNRNLGLLFTQKSYFV